MKQALTVENYGITKLDAQAMQGTDGGSDIGHAIGEAIGFVYVCFRELSRGAGESAAEMPGLK